MTVLITVWGASPGVGKSTLCAGLVQWLADTGLRVDHFREEEILTRPQFAAVADEFKATGTVQLQTLIAAAAKFVDAVMASGDDVVIADALMPFVPTLLAMGHGDEMIDAFMTDLTEVLARVRPVMVFLDGNAQSALSRAATREGEQWLDWYVGKLASYNVSPPVADVASAVKYLLRERAVTLGAARRNDWGLVVIERADELPPGEVLRVAQRGLGPWLPGPLHTDRTARQCDSDGRHHDRNDLRLEY
jgi:thymidylate kinase